MTTQTRRLPWRMVPTQSTTRQKSFFEQLVEQDQNRLQEFFDDFEAHCEGESIDIENLVRDPAFISAATQVAQQAEGNHEPEKLEQLRNKLLDLAKKQSTPQGKATQTKSA